MRQSHPAIRLEQIIYLTASFACLVFFCLVPMHALKLNFKDVLSDTQCGDEQIRKMAASNRMPHSILLNNCPITDACLPWLESIAPKYLPIQGTQISANGLLSASFPQTQIVVEPGQFTAEELQQLRARKFQVEVKARAILME